MKRSHLFKGAAVFTAAVLGLTGCSVFENDADSENKTAAETVMAKLTGYPSAEDYYAYVNDVLLADSVLAPADTVETVLDTGYDFASTLSREAIHGIVCADVRDYDNDGELEMLLIRLENHMLWETYLADCFYDTTSNIEINGETGKECAYCFTPVYLDNVGGEITQILGSSVRFSVLPTDGWGNMIVGLEQVNDDFYLFAHVASENHATYGPSYMIVEQLNPQLHPVYVSAIPELGLSKIEAENMLEIEEPLEIQKLSLADLTIPDSTNPTVEENLDALGTRLLCSLDVNYTRGESSVYQTAYDFTDLRHYLETGGSDWEMRELPEGYEREMPDASEDMLAFIQTIDDAAGTSFAANGIDILDNTDGIYTASIEDGTLQHDIDWDTEKSRPSRVRLTEDYNEVDNGVWYVAKDAMLKEKAFGFSDTDVAPLLGKVGWTDFSGGYEIGDYRCLIFAIDDAGIMLEYK